MSDHERIYAILVEANPVPDPNALPETLNEARTPLRIVSSDRSSQDDDIAELLPDTSSRTAPRAAVRVAIAAGLVLLVGLGIALRPGPDTQPTDIAGQPKTETPIEQATAFIDRLDAGDLDGASELLADPWESVWFIPIGQLTNNEELRNYLEFYQAAGVTSHLTGCAAEIVGPSTVVTCAADQQSEALLPLDLRFPAFDMTFDVWDDGIRTIGWVQHEDGDFNTAFSNSRFFEFSSAVLAPQGLLQGSGDPVWSKENGELMTQLVDEFLADGS